MLPNSQTLEEWEKFLQRNEYSRKVYWVWYQELNQQRTWKPSIVLSINSASKRFWEAQEWCQANCKAGWNNFNTWYWEFESSFDAMMFKMYWCGRDK